MKRSIVALVLSVITISCTHFQKSVVPASNKIVLEDTYTIIWNGKSEAYKFDNNEWHRYPQYDYQFSVIQKRYKQQWKSIKTLQRIHPSYDGKAGGGDQTMYFEISYTGLKNDSVSSIIHSSIGDGIGVSDKQFRNAAITMDVKGVSDLAPYNKIRIQQNYNYEKGELNEIVELYKEKDGKEFPFMKNEETAVFYTKGMLKEAPTIYTLEK